MIGRDSKMPNKLFVYGTLKKGYRLHGYLENSPFLKEAQIPNHVLLDLGSFPGMVLGEGKVKGEIYEVSDEVIDTLDHVEGTPTFYNRETVTTDEGEQVFAYVYQGAYQSKYKVVDGGNW
jgi:gamma-glutamylaminecyclotransferase